MEHRQRSQIADNHQANSVQNLPGIPRKDKEEP